jgi:ubiquinone/menaquinone biosynthesis C-methylase UbiE
MESQREEYNFYTNQCLAEIRRVGKDNGKLLIDHFIQMSQTECSYINQAHVMWADFLSHFQEEQELQALDSDHPESNLHVEETK